MKKIRLILILTQLFFSCNLAEKIEQIQKINDDLEQHFNHDSINIVNSYGTNAGDNHIEVTFYEYDVSSIEYQKLKKNI